MTVLLVEETGISGENYTPAGSNYQALSHQAYRVHHVTRWNGMICKYHTITAMMAPKMIIRVYMFYINTIRYVQTRCSILIICSMISLKAFNQICHDYQRTVYFYACGNIFDDRD